MPGPVFDMVGIGRFCTCLRALDESIARIATERIHTFQVLGSAIDAWGLE
jgi:hypothetical protein